MHIWTVANQKGGVGKTTTTVALAGLAAQAGKRVLLVDMDPHGSLTSYFRQNPDRIKLSTFTLFESKDVLSQNFVNQLLINTEYECMRLLPSSTALATLERKMIGEGMGLVMAKALSAVEGMFDLAIIDCPPSLGVLMVNALAACEHLIIPVQTEFLAIKGLERMLKTLDMLGKSRHYPLPFTIVPTMFDRRTQASVSSLRAIRHDFGCDVWPGKIPIDTRLRDASKQGVPPHIFDTNSRSVVAYRSLYNRLENTRCDAMLSKKAV